MSRFNLILVAACLSLTAFACSETRRPPTGPSPIDGGVSPFPPSPAPIAPPAVVGVVGDIGWCGSPGVAQTARIAEGIDGPILLAGDNAYMDGTIQDYIRCFDPSWGNLRRRWRPSPGNHDYFTPNAAGYFQYFGEAASGGGGGRSFYSFSAGEWLVLMLNSNIDVRFGSEQYEFVRVEMERSRTRCQMAVWHHPLFSSGPNGNNPFMRDMFALLYQKGADVVVAGHDHLYERFGKQDVDGRSDGGGIRQFIAGTGGAQLYDFLRMAPNSQVRIKSFGVLRLTLHPGNYDWAFIDGSGNMQDSGTDGCH